jgi:lipopolysaccharide/colanic/teichoic acid biosynthesis glycosyltransferase
MDDSVYAFRSRRATTPPSAKTRVPAIQRIDARRVVDLVVVVLALPVLIPLGLLVALAVFIDSPGPIFFACPRIGRDGRPFRMWKFRKMRRGAVGASLTRLDDERLTPIGRSLVDLRLDELPQVWNVVKGEMRLVGPRPEIEEFVDLYASAYREILSVPPGIIGVSQLAFLKERELFTDPATAKMRYGDQILPKKIELDLRYVDSRTLPGDLAILARTVELPFRLVLRKLRRLLAAIEVPRRGWREACLCATLLVTTFLLQAGRTFG